jgi:hypothetical protein
MRRPFATFARFLRHAEQSIEVLGDPAKGFRRLDVKRSRVGKIDRKEIRYAGGPLGQNRAMRA